MLKNINLVILALLFTSIANSQCTVSPPTTSNECSFGATSIDLTATGSTGKYRWYDALTGGNLLGSSSTFTTPVLNATTNYYVSAIEENNALDFDGSNDYVNIGNPAAVQITGDMTIEMWVKPDNFSGRKNPYEKAYGGEGTITQETNGSLNYFYGTSGVNSQPYQGFNSVTTLTAGQWSHIAIVRDLTNMKLYWYVNGVLTNQTNATYASATSGNNAARIGAGYAGRYDGNIDELRIWSSARTQVQVQTNMNTCVDASEASLNAYYKLDDGSGMTIATDDSPNGNNGTLTNMNSNTAWTLPGSPGSCNCESDRTVAVAEITNSTPLDLGADICTSSNVVLDAGAGYSSYLWNTGATTQSITVTVDGEYWVEVDNGAGCTERDNITVTFMDPPISSDVCGFGATSFNLEASGSTGIYKWYDALTGGNLLGSGSTYTTPVINTTTNYYVAALEANTSIDFDGVNDYVNLGNPAAVQITADMTIEMWVKPDNFSGRKNPYEKAYGGEGTITQETNGTLSYYYGTSGSNNQPYQGFNSITTLTAGQWSHIAIVRDLANMKLYWYINGVLTNQTNANYANATSGNNAARIGAGYAGRYDGQIDELRIWSAARSLAELQANMNSCVGVSEANLNAYYKMDDGTGSLIISDSSPFNSTGNLINMDSSTDWILPGSSISCNCETDRITVVAQIINDNPVDLGDDICTSSSVILDAGVGYTNYLWNTGETTQSITVSTAGEYWVEVDNGSGCTNKDNIFITFIDQPIATDVCSFEPTSFNLQATGSTGIYQWYDAPNGGNLLGSGANYTTPVINTTTNYYVAGLEANYALDFDGVNDYVSIGNPAAVQITGNMTIEMWVKPDNFSSRKNPYAKAYGGEGTITQEPDGKLNYYYGTNGGNNQPYQGFNSSTSLIAGQWSHIAIVRDLTNMKLYWYINGVLTNQTNANFPSATAGSNSALIGAGYVNKYDGQIDEVRIWSSARTIAQIQSNMNNCIDASENNLNAYYKMDDGTTAIATDSSPYGNNANLLNMDPATDWITNVNGIDCNCESDRTTVIAQITPGTPVNLGPDMILGCSSTNTLLDAGSGYTNYLWSTGATSQTININTEGAYWVKVDYGNICADMDTINVSSSSGSMASLNLNGVNNYVDLGNDNKLQITGDMTVEMWVKPDNFSSRKNPYAKAYGGEGTITQETNGTFNYYYGTNGGNGGPYQGFNSSLPLKSGKWSHIAIVRDLTNMKLYWYINGKLTNIANAQFGAATSSNRTVRIGRGYTNYYDGQIDEVRIWSSARTESEVRAKMCSKLNGSEPSLTAYYQCNDNVGAVLTDKSNNGLNGSLKNGTFWSTSGAHIGDESVYLYTNSWAAKTLDKTICEGEHLTVSNMSGSPDGVHIYSVGVVPNSTSNIVGLGLNDRYFGVFKANDATATYHATYHYDNNPHVTANNEDGLALFTRANNSIIAWSEAVSILDISAKTIETTASGTEFILGTHRFILPITLVSFDATMNDNHEVDLDWITANEIDNDFFTIEKTFDGEYWTEVVTIEGAGNSTETLDYKAVDFQPLTGVSYYRLKQTDFDGHFTYSEIRMVKNTNHLSPSRDLLVWPNPNSGSQVNIELNGYNKNSVVQLSFRNILGVSMLNKNVHTDSNGHIKDIINTGILPVGTYIITVTNGANRDSIRLIIL